jgi:hypothetical protein
MIRTITTLVLSLLPVALHAQQATDSTRWVLGMALGYTGIYAAITTPDQAVLVTGPINDRPPIPRDGGGEGVLAVRAGRTLNRFARADIVLSLNFIGMGPGNHQGGTEQTDDGGGEYTTSHFENGDDIGFAAGVVHVVVEDRSNHAIVRPRAGIVGGWAMTKGPVAGLTAGLSAGRAHTCFTADVGEQYTWLHYDTVLNTYQLSNDQFLRQVRVRGSDKLHGVSLRLGVEHYVNR